MLDWCVFCDLGRFASLDFRISYLSGISSGLGPKLFFLTFEPFFEDPESEEETDSARPW